MLAMGAVVSDSAAHSVRRSAETARAGDRNRVFKFPIRR